MTSSSRNSRRSGAIPKRKRQTAGPHQIDPKIRRLIRTGATIKLDLGCGPSKQDDAIGIDARNLPGVDIVHDLETFPWPLPSNCARAVVISHFWEHLKPWLTLRFMEELHRVCVDGAGVFMSGPFGVEFRYVQDPTHCNPSNEATFQYWDNMHPLWQVYKPPVFHIEKWTVHPVGGMGRDFNLLYRVCKRWEPDGTCPHKTQY